MATSRRRRAWLPGTLLQNMRSSSAGQQPVGAQPGAGARRDHRASVRCSDRAAGGSTVIDCQGRTLTPGLIDNPWQTMLAAPPPIAGAVHVSPLAGSPDEARLRTRQQLLPGASQIKVEATPPPATGAPGSAYMLAGRRPSTAPSGIALAAVRPLQAANCCR
jgi:hypothetical protein